MGTNLPPSSTSRYYIATLIAVLGWGLSTSLIQFGLVYVEPFLFLALRFSMAALLATPYVLYTRKNEVLKLLKNRWIYAIALFETAGLLFQYQGQLSEYNVSAGLASLLTMMFIIIVPALSYYLLREKFTINHAIAILLGFIGVFLIVTQGNLSNLTNSSTIGVILLLLSATCYAFYQIVTSKYTREVNKSVDSLALFYVVMVAISVYSFGFTFIHSDFSISLNFPVAAWFWIIALAIFSTIVAFVAYFEASKGIPANTLSILLILQMLVPFFVDIVILGKHYSIWIYLGGIIIVLGMIFIAKIPTDPKSSIFQPEVPSQHG